MTVADRFRAAVEARDMSAFDELFAPDVRFFSPVTFTPFVGAPIVRGLLGVLLRTFEDFRYVGTFTGSAEMGGSDVESHILIFRAAVAGKQIHGIDLIQPGESGLIEEFTVMVRPMSAVVALRDAVNAGLVAAGLIPAPAAEGAR
jgi:hypothetical protein